MSSECEWDEALERHLRRSVSEAESPSLATAAHGVRTLAEAMRVEPRPIGVPPSAVRGPVESIRCG